MLPVVCLKEKSGKMRILWFPRLQTDIDKFHITTWREMCRELEEMGHDVKIAIAGSEAEEMFGKRCIPVPIIRRKVLRVLSFAINGCLKFIVSYIKFKPDVVILDWFSIWFNLPFILIPRRSRALIIMDSRSPLQKLTALKSLSNAAYRIYTRLCLFHCKHFLDGMTVITSYYKEKICNDFDFDPSFVGVWSSGVNLFNFSPKKYEESKRPLFLNGKFVLMQHGEISYNRGYFETIRALKMTKSDVCLVLIGDSISTSRVKEEVEKLSKELCVEQKIFILPPVSYLEIPKYISYCDCAIMAYPDTDYWNLNNPIKLLEYLAMGKVVICTDMWTFNDVMGRGKCAYYLKDDSPEVIAEAINFCYENRDRLHEWGRTGTEIVKQRYTWRKQAENLIHFIVHLKRNR